MSRLLSTWETKQILGITGTSKDTLVDLWAIKASEILAGILQVADVASHAVTDEEVRVFNYGWMLVEDQPVDTAQTVTVKDINRDEVTGYSWTLDSKLKRKLFAVDGNGKPLTILHDTFFVSYTAGYRVAGSIAFLTNPAAGRTLTFKHQGVETTYTFVSGTPGTTDIQIGATAADTATNTKNKLTGSSVSSSTVTLDLGDSITADTLTTGEATVLNPNIPEDLKVACALIAGGGISERDKVGGVTSYTLGSKTVQFSSQIEADRVAMIVETWAPRFKKARIFV